MTLPQLTLLPLTPLLWLLNNQKLPLRYHRRDASRMRPFLFCPRPGCAPQPAHHKLQAQGAHPTEAIKAQACSLRLSKGASDKRRGIHTPYPYDLQSKGDTQRIASLPHPTSITQRSAVQCQTQRGAAAHKAYRAEESSPTKKLERRTTPITFSL